ncbi:hypothetical protein V5799_001106 [Amblyomma americanum]|uniref:Carboxylesterase type B domain-containing protein n=1 Tax=Amblyomma americanum TaxID=6943 RepID=A0AAQ4D149_AMBAM
MPQGALDLDGRNPRYPCVQHNLYYGNVTIVEASNTTEDCLHLDVYAPRASSSYEQLPGTGRSAVLVALIDIHFANGGNSYYFADPRRFVNSTGVLVVVPNYRLGALGFMRSGKQRSPGNMGLLDQALMLRWVRDNVFSFGGNPHNIILMGAGGGAVAAGYHLLSPITRGFTRRAILHSGSPLIPFPALTTDDPLDGIAHNAQCSKDGAGANLDQAATLSCLHDRPTEVLRDALTEGHYPVTQDSFLPLPFETMLAQSTDQTAQLSSGDGSQCHKRFFSLTRHQVLVGNVIDEGSLTVAHVFRNLTANDWRSSKREFIIDKLLTFLEPYKVPHLDKIIKCYLSNPDKAQQVLTFFDVASEMIGDMLYVCPMKRFADLFSQAGNRVSYFVFTYKPAASTDRLGTHATQLDDVLSVFGTHAHPSELRFTERLMKHWGEFAKSGDLPSLKGGRPWPPYTMENPRYVFLENREDGELSTEEKEDYRDQQCKYWADYLSMQSASQQPEDFRYKCEEISPNA